MTKILVNPTKYEVNFPPFTDSFPNEKLMLLGITNLDNKKFSCLVGTGFPYEPVHLRTSFDKRKDATEWGTKFISKWNSLHGITK